jgi:hypothetical protein
MNAFKRLRSTWAAVGSQTTSPPYSNPSVILAFHSYRIIFDQSVVLLDTDNTPAYSKPIKKNNCIGHETTLPVIYLKATVAWFWVHVNEN